MNYHVSSGKIKVKINKDNELEAAMSFMLRMIEYGEHEIDNDITVVNDETNKESIFDTDDVLTYLGYGPSDIKLKKDISK